MTYTSRINTSNRGDSSQHLQDVNMHLEMPHTLLCHPQDMALMGAHAPALLPWGLQALPGHPAPNTLHPAFSWLLLFPKSPIIPKLLFKQANGCLPELLHQTPTQPFVCLSECMCVHFSSFSAVVIQAIGPKEGVLRIPEHSSLGPLPSRALCTI